MSTAAAPANAPSVEHHHSNAQVLQMRTRLFQALFYKLSLAYAKLCPRPIRTCLEFLVLTKALLALVILSYIHIRFIRTPTTCLHGVEWPKDGILRVEILRSPSMLALSNLTSRSDEEVLMPPSSIFSTPLEGFERLLVDGKPESNSSFSPPSSEDLLERDAEGSLFSVSGKTTNEYIVEYALEYGILRLTPSARERLQIPIKTITLDPTTQECFGDGFSRFLLENYLGYEDVIMASLKNIAEKEDSKGYVWNVVTGEYFKFANIWMSQLSYVTAAFIMLVFTLSISMLLRYSHHQIFLFILELIHMVEFNIPLSFPAAPLLTVVLALVGMEAIMAEFFNDSSTAFYIILIVWVADQYDALCCHSPLTRKHWLRFFYLYHFAFYAYDYRFNGQYSGLALLTSWLFIQHSMLFFFHHFELPNILSEAQADNNNGEESRRSSVDFSPADRHTEATTPPSS